MIKHLMNLVLIFFASQTLLGQNIKKEEMNSLYPFKQNVGNKIKYGYIDRQGKIVIAPTFDRARDFYEGIGLVEINGLYGYIDLSGKYAIKPQFDYAERFSEGLAFVEKGDQVGFIDKSGAWQIQNLEEQVNNMYNYIFSNNLGEGVVEITFHNGVAQIYSFIKEKSEGKEKITNAITYYINREGNLVDTVQAEFLYNTYEGKYIDYPPGGGTVILNNSGDTIITSIYQISSFSEGLAVFYNENIHKNGFIDAQGETAIPAKFEYAQNFYEGLAAAAAFDSISGIKYGFINKQGDWVIPPVFDQADSFHNGLARVELIHENEDFSRKITASYIDHQGNKIFTFEYILPAPPIFIQPDILEVPEDH